MTNLSEFFVSQSQPTATVRCQYFDIRTANQPQHNQCQKNRVTARNDQPVIPFSHRLFRPDHEQIYRLSLPN